MKIYNKRLIEALKKMKKDREIAIEDVDINDYAQWLSFEGAVGVLTFLIESLQLEVDWVKRLEVK